MVTFQAGVNYTLYLDLVRLEKFSVDHSTRFENLTTVALRI